MKSDTGFVCIDYKQIRYINKKTSGLIAGRFTFIPLTKHEKDLQQLYKQLSRTIQRDMAAFIGNIYQSGRSYGDPVLVIVFGQC